MIEDIGGVTSKLVMLALDAASLRQATYANNVANVHSEGFQAGRVSFESQLNHLKSSLLDRSNDVNNKIQLGGVQPRVERSNEMISPGASSVRLEQEMVRLTKNAIHYQALLTGIGKLSSITKMAILGRI